MSNKTLAIYFSDPEPMGYPFSKEVYFEKYQEVITAIESHNITVWIVRGDSYIGNKQFTHGWSLVQGAMNQSTGPITVDLIWNRDDKNTIPRIEDCPIINHPDLDELCVDKFKTFELFPELSPKTSLVHSYQAFLACVQTWDIPHTTRLVLKKNFETEGRGIFILPLAEITEAHYDNWSDILVQEFIDSSVGIPGLVEGLHDLRINVVNDTPINAYIRVPKKGSFLANVALGGSGTSVALEQLPTEAIEAVHLVRKQLANFQPSLYAADFMNSPQGFRLVELNSRPAVQHPDWSKTYKRFNDALVTMLVEALNGKT